MNDELKTIAQIAQDLNVSRQAVYKKLKKNPDLTTSLQPYTTTKGKLIVYDSQGQELIKQAFQNQPVNRADNQRVNQSVTSDNQMLTSLQQQNSLLQSELDVLKTQLTDKDNQINLLKSQIADRDKTIASLQADKDKLNARLDKAEDNISSLSTALTAAQALHGMDKQQAAIEVKEEPKELASEEEPEQPQQKLSFFQRLFRKRSE